MNAIGLFEAKTRFSENCARVASKGEAVLVTRRGKPLVKIAPIPESESSATSVWDRRAHHVKKQGRLTEAFALPTREKQAWRNPLDKL